MIWTFSDSSGASSEVAFFSFSPRDRAAAEQPAVATTSSRASTTTDDERE